MATFSDGPTIPMPDFSLQNSSAGDMKFHLQNLLDSKEKQLQQAGTLGQRVLAQQMELEERIRQLQEIDADKAEDDELNTEAAERYRELADTIKAWDAENAQLSSAFGNRVSNLFCALFNIHIKAPDKNDAYILSYIHTFWTICIRGSDLFQQRSRESSPLMAPLDLPREEPERSKVAGSSAAQSRRAKNAAHRADDVGALSPPFLLYLTPLTYYTAEFAFEIGSGLLTEVRRLQSLLGERDKAIQDMKEEKDDLEKSIESLRTALRQQEQSAGTRSLSVLRLH